jgi:predicted dehydrogenase
MEDLKIAAVGAWGHLGRVLAELDQTPALRLRAMCKALPEEDLDKYRAAHSCARDARVFDDHRRLLDEVRPDVVIVSTRPDRIAPLAIEAASRGCHLICEKPLAIEHDSLRRLWDTCAAQRVQCHAILNNHVHPVVFAARRAVDHGLIGTVALCNARKSYKWADREAWFGRRDLYGGTIPWIGIHALDFIYSVTGQWFTSVAAMQSNIAHPAHAECEDNCALILSLTGGGHATASLDLLRPAAADTHGDDWIRVVGSDGVIEASLTRNRCVLTTAADAPRDLPLPERTLSFASFLAELSRGTSATGSPDAETLRAFALTHAALLARDAADGRRFVEIDSAFESNP